MKNHEKIQYIQPDSNGRKRHKYADFCPKIGPKYKGKTKYLFHAVKTHFGSSLHPNKKL